MKFVMSWQERPCGSAREYEEAQERVLEMMQSWTAPQTVTFHQFLVRVGQYGGYAVIEADDMAAIHEMTSTFAVFQFDVAPVIEVGEALAAEGAAAAWRASIGQTPPAREASG